MDAKQVQTIGFALGWVRAARGMSLRVWHR